MNIVCSICTELFEVVTELVITATSCGHIFHHHCLSQWLERSQTCPQCRQTLTIQHCRTIYLPTEGDTSGIESLHLQIKNLKIEIKKQEEQVCELKSQAEEIRNTYEQVNKELVTSEHKRESLVQELRIQERKLDDTQKNQKVIQNENTELKKNINEEKSKILILIKEVNELNELNKQLEKVLELVREEKLNIQNMVSKKDSEILQLKKMAFCVVKFSQYLACALKHSTKIAFEKQHHFEYKTAEFKMKNEALESRIMKLKIDLSSLNEEYVRTKKNLKEVEETQQKNLVIIWSVFIFYTLLMGMFVYNFFQSQDIAFDQEIFLIGFCFCVFDLVILGTF